MEPVLVVDDIQWPSTVKHTLSKPKKLFPFITKNTTQLAGNFHIVISEMARNITRYELKKHELDKIMYQYHEGAQKLSEFIANSEAIDFQGDDEAKVDFIRFIDAYLFKGDQINIIHSYLYNFIGESESNQSMLRNLAEFLSNVFVGDDEEIHKIFKDKETDDILTKLIITEIDKLVETKKGGAYELYSNIFPNLTQLYRDDIKFLMKHKEYFIANFELITNFYSLMYTIQSVIQFEKLTKGDYENAQPMYFALEWESVTKKRAVAGNLTGYKFVKEYATNLFAHEYVLRLLSHNIFNKHIETGKEVMGYSTLLHQIESHGPQYVAQFQEDLKRLIETYRKWSEKDHEPFVLGETTEERINQLFNLVSQRMHDDAQKKFGQSIEFLGRGTFLKQRGSLGYLFNITHDFLILMTAVIVKDERMPFKTLLKEFEKRGVAFDRHSVEEIIAVFNSHNILDKKSDSGDAQYVKPIL